jgi:hypothetical protein
MPVGELIQKAFAALWPMFYGLSIFLFVWAGYKSLIWIMLWFLKRHLKKKDLEGFKKVLGTNYKAKSLGEGDKRYKWNKWVFAVKANFDNEGNLICNFIEPVHFWSVKSVLSFV